MQKGKERCRRRSSGSSCGEENGPGAPERFCTGASPSSGGVFEEEQGTSLPSLLRGRDGSKCLVILAALENPECSERMRGLAAGQREMLPLTVISDKITFYAEVKYKSGRKSLEKIGV